MFLQDTLFIAEMQKNKKLIQSSIKVRAEEERQREKGKWCTSCAMFYYQYVPALNGNLTKTE
jgi:hypothetical protein